MTGFPTEGMTLTKLLVISDIDASVRSYRNVLGAGVLREYGDSSCVLTFAGAWLLLVTGGPQTADKPTVTFAPPADRDSPEPVDNLHLRIETEARVRSSRAAASCSGKAKTIASSSAVQRRASARARIVGGRVHAATTLAEACFRAMAGPPRP